MYSYDANPKKKKNYKHQNKVYKMIKISVCIILYIL